MKIHILCDFKKKINKSENLKNLDVLNHLCMKGLRVNIKQQTDRETNSKLKEQLNVNPVAQI